MGDRSFDNGGTKGVGWGWGNAFERMVNSEVCFRYLPICEDNRMKFL